MRLGSQPQRPAGGKLRGLQGEYTRHRQHCEPLVVLLKRSFLLLLLSDREHKTHTPDTLAFANRSLAARKRLAAGKPQFMRVSRSLRSELLASQQRPGQQERLLGAKANVNPLAEVYHVITTPQRGSRRPPSNTHVMMSAHRQRSAWDPPMFFFLFAHRSTNLTRCPP